MRTCLMACSSFAVLVVALAPAPVLAATSSPACYHANLNNPGHHYGLIKNGCLQQPPPPPVPTSHPTLHPSAAPIPKLVPAVAVVTKPVQPITSVAPGQSAQTGGNPVETAPAPLKLTSPRLVAKPATANLPADDHNVWARIGLLGSVLLLLLLAALGVYTYLRRRQQMASAPAQ